MTATNIGSYVGFGNVATSYATDGTASDIDFWYHLEGGNDGLELDREEIMVESLAYAEPHYLLRMPGQRRVTGNVTIRIPFSSLQDLLRHITAHNIAVSGVGPYTYAFVPKNYDDSAHYWSTANSGLGQNFLIEVYRGQGTNSVFYQGCVFTSWAMTFEPGGIVELSLDVLARGYTIGAKSTAAYDADFMVTTTGQTTTLVTLNGAALANSTIRRVAINVTEPLAPNFGVTGIETDIPVFEGLRETTLELERELDDDTTTLGQLDAFTTLGPTNGGANTIEIDGVAGISNAAWSLKFTFGEMNLLAPAEVRAEGPGIRVGTSTFKVLTDGTLPTYQPTLINGDSAYLF